MIRKTNLAVALSAVLMITAPTPSHALIQTSDIPNLMQTIVGNIQRMHNWLEEKEVMLSELTQRGDMTGLLVDGENNAAANIITRLGKTLEEIQNIEQLQRSMPAVSACGTITVSKAVDDASCEIQETISTNTGKYAGESSGYTDTPKEFKKRKIKIAQKIVDQCRALSEGESIDEGTVPDSSEATYSLPPECIRADYLMGGMGRDTFTKAEDEASKLAVKIIAGPIPDGKISANASDNLTTNTLRLKDYRKHALRLMVASSLEQVRAERVASADHGLSYVDMLNDFVEERFGGEAAIEYQKLTLNVHPEAEGKDINKMTTPEQVEREIKILQDFQAYLSLKRYKQQLRAEALTAAILSTQIDPVK